MFSRYEFSIGLALSILSAAWLVYLANLPLDALSAQRGAVAIGAMLFFVGILVILHSSIPNPKHLQLRLEEQHLRNKILEALTHTSISRDELETYIRNVTGQPSLRHLNLDQLDRIERYVQSNWDD